MCQQSKITIILSFNPVVKDEVTLSNSWGRARHVQHSNDTVRTVFYPVSPNSAPSLANHHHPMQKQILWPKWVASKSTNVNLTNAVFHPLCIPITSLSDSCLKTEGNLRCTIYSGQLTQQPMIFGMYEEIREPGTNPCGHRQTTHKQHLWAGLNLDHWSSVTMALPAAPCTFWNFKTFIYGVSKPAFCSVSYPRHI